ncbi:MAG: hypothetical protein DLM68_18440 [Hyphomicrobiales bacterium]|nr:MAG: hypothetical protein DLM68_18440 [Hyphomicrobiales bacterium]
MASFTRIPVRTSAPSPSFGAGGALRSYLNSIAWPRTTLPSAARDIGTVRAISLTGRGSSR